MHGTGKWLLALVASVCVAACSSSGGSKITVRVVSDLTPGVEAANINTRLFAGVDATTSIRTAQMDHAVRFDDALARGIIVAELDHVTSGDHLFIVDVFRPNGARIAGRPVIANVSADATITVVITADCATVQCPNAGSPGLSACLAGQCVDPRCSAETPEFCPPALICNQDVDCVSEPSAECAEQACSGHVCVETPKDGVCSADEYCARGVGCTSYDAPQGPDPLCDRVCIVGDDVCRYGYFRCDAQRHNPVCTSIVNSDRGKVCRDNGACDGRGACVDSSTLADAGVMDGGQADAAPEALTDARIDAPRDATADARLDAARDATFVDASFDATMVVHPPLDATVDAAPDASIDEVVDGSLLPDAPPVLIQPWLTGNSAVFPEVSPYAKQLGFSLPSAPTSTVCYDVSTPDTDELTIVTSPAQLCFSPTDYTGIWIEVRAIDDNVVDFDQDISIVLTPVDAPQYGALTVDGYTIDDDGIQCVSCKHGAALPSEVELSNFSADITDDASTIVLATSSTALLSDTGCTAYSAIVINDRYSPRLLAPIRGLAGACPDGPSQTPRLNSNGAKIFFLSSATNLVEGDTNGTIDLFYFNWNDYTMERVNVGVMDAQSTSHVASYDVSGDGRFVAFTSADGSLTAADDTNGLFDLYVRDLQLGTTTLVSHTPSGDAGNNQTVYFSMARDGSKIVFFTESSDMSDGIGTYLYEISTGVITFLGADLGHPRLTPDGQKLLTIRSGGDFGGYYGALGITYSYYSYDSAGHLPPYVTFGIDLRAASYDGQFITIDNEVPLTADDMNGKRDVYLRDTGMGVTSRISHTHTGGDPNGDSTSSRITPDGRYVLFVSNATNMVPGATESGNRVYLAKR